MSWTPTRALHRGVVVTALALVAAAGSGRVELVLLAVPFALGTALSLTSRPVRQVRSGLSFDQPATVEGGPVAARVTVTNDNAEPVLCHVTSQTPRWVQLRHGVGRYATLARARATSTVFLQGVALRWGRYQLGPVQVTVVACDGLLAAHSGPIPAVPLTVHPRSSPFDSRQVLPPATGVVGSHRSWRPGDGMELTDVRAFRAGDPLRRINWRVSQRTGELHVNATSADRDAEVLLVLDVRYEAGVAGGGSVLDATVRAAAAITEHYAHQGDRVGLLEYGAGLRRLPSGTGRLHSRAALEWLSGVDPAPFGTAPGFRLLLPRLRPPTALLVVLTPVLDPDAAVLLATLMRAGRLPVTVDTLPELVVPAAGEWTSAAHRIWRLERANTIGRLREIGIPVEPWRGTGSLDLMLRHAARSGARRAR